MNKTTIYGLPLNPLSKLEQLKGASFCVSYATRKKLGRQLDDAIRLVGKDGILLVDNGAYSAFQSGINTMHDENYLEGYATWANDILARCPQAIAVFPDVIDGTEQENYQLITETAFWLDSDRTMPVWHMHESIDYLLDLCERFGYIGFGSSGEYLNYRSPKWQARIKEALDAIDYWVARTKQANETGDEKPLRHSIDVRPRIHMMKAQSQAHLFDFDSSDSTNVAMNHNRWADKHGRENHIARMAATVDNRIQASAGPTAEHQIKRPLLDHLETAKHYDHWFPGTHYNEWNYAKPESKQRDLFTLTP